MSEKKIVIQIDENGGINAETFGMVGTECAEELDKLMKDIAKRGSRKKKKEYYEQKSKTTAKVTNKRD